jgi:predicted molibdopterin-dependent oxidoreductase YjgC
MIRLTIDGKEVLTEEGKTILEAARENGIYIPTFCYHEKLLPIGSCRLCLVEVDGYDKPMTSCTTPALEGITVTTHSEKLVELRKQYLQLILTSHPLDCPQCDKGGECQLQNLAYEHGIEKSEYEALRKDHKEVHPSPLIHYWEQRCVLCGRCWHACREISGRSAIDIVGNGFEARVSGVDQDDCISCGECLSVCPVGALTEALSPTKSRIWQSERIDTTCPHCGFGCQLTLNVLEGKTITKVITDKRLPPNDDSLCVRGRFGYDFVDNVARIKEAYLNKDGARMTITNEEALRVTAENLKRISAEGKAVGFIVSPRATNEEIFMISRIARALGNSRTASSAHYHTAKVARAFERMGINPVYDYRKIKNCGTVIVAGADLLINNHLLANKVREAVKLEGTRIIVVDPLPSSLARIADAHLKVVPGRDDEVFNAFSRRLLDEGNYNKEAEGFAGFSAFKESLLKTSPDDTQNAGGVDNEMLERAYRLISHTDNVGVIFASGITASEKSLNALLNFCLLKGLPERGLIMPASLQSNAWGAVSLAEGMVSPDSLLGDPGVAGLFIYEDDPFGYLNGGFVKDALAKKDFTAVCDILPTFVMDHAAVVIPSAAFAEKEGTFLSGDGALRTVRKAVKGPSAGFEFLDGLLAVLGQKRYETPEKVTEEIRLEGIVQKYPDGTERLAAKTGKAAFAENPDKAPEQGNGGSGKHQLILRDIFMNHHLCDKDVYSQGIGRVQSDLLRISPEDAAELNLSSGDSALLKTEAGVMTSPVLIKKEMKKGVLELVLFRRRGEALSLSPKIAKLIDAEISKT